jgi:hypothetical protein
MTQGEVINKLSVEMAVKLEDFDKLNICRKYIQMALAVGVEHFTKDMEEIIQMDRFGVEIARFKGITDASIKIGMRQGDISAVLTGQQHTAGGFIFMKSKDKELVPRQKTA